MFQPYLHQAVQSLQSLSSDELRDLLGDDEKLDERVNEALKTLESSKDLIIDGNRRLAEANLEFEPKMIELKSRVHDLTAEYRTLGESVKEKTIELAAKSDKVNAEAVLALLQTAAVESEDESEKIVQQLMDSELTVDAYLEQFMSTRKLMHNRKVKAEKMIELIRNNNRMAQAYTGGSGPSHGSPYPSPQTSTHGGYYVPPAMSNSPSASLPYPIGPTSMPVSMFRAPPQF